MTTAIVYKNALLIGALLFAIASFIVRAATADTEKAWYHWYLMGTAAGLVIARAMFNIIVLT